MESGDCASRCEEPCAKAMEKSGDVSAAGASREVVEPPTNTKETASLGPITPDANRETGEFPYDCSSPPTAAKESSKVSSFSNNGDRCQDAIASSTSHGSPRTPEGGVFDPFAPGPDCMALAPLCKKYIDQMRTSVARRLNFDDSVRSVSDGPRRIDLESISDEEMFESVYENLLETIVSNQAEGLLAEFSKGEWNSDICKTPMSAPCLNGIAETCPGAPIKRTGKLRNIDLGLCRKLEF